MKVKPWRNWEIRILKHYSQLEMETLTQEFGRDARAIQNKTQRLGIRKKRRWSEEEYLIAWHYEGRDYNELARLLGKKHDRHSAWELIRYVRKKADRKSVV